MFYIGGAINDTLCIEYDDKMHEHVVDHNKITISFGMSEYVPNKDTTILQTFTRADVAMYKYKADIKTKKRSYNRCIFVIILSMNDFYRKATLDDLDEVMIAVEDSREVLRLQGNGQWQDGYPNRDDFINDIRNGRLFVVLGDNEEVAGVCALTYYEEDYHHLYEGSWKTDLPYMVMHRVAVKKKYEHQGYGKKLFLAFIDVAKKEGYHSLRIDTHEGNPVMRHLISIFGFEYCGKAILTPNKDRLVFEKVIEDKEVKNIHDVKRVYVACSFAYEDIEKTKNRKKEIEDTVSHIKTHFDKDCYFHMPHTYKMPNAWDLSLEEWSKRVYENDKSEIDKADLLLFLSYGKENNAGSVWEVGYAFAKNKKIIMLRMSDDVESIMLFGSVDVIINYDNVDEYNWEDLPEYKIKFDKLS